MKRIALLTLIALNAGRILAEPIQPAKAIKQESIRILIHENNVRYVIASKTDSYYKISKQTGIKLSQLHHYNESFKEKDMLIEIIKNEFELTIDMVVSKLLVYFIFFIANLNSKLSRSSN